MPLLASPGIQTVKFGHLGDPIPYRPLQTFIAALLPENRTFMLLKHVPASTYYACRGGHERLGERGSLNNIDVDRARRVTEKLSAEFWLLKGQGCL